MRPLLILDCYVDPAGGAGNFLRQLGERPVEVLRPTREPVPCTPGRWSGVLITGSAGSFADGCPWAADLIALLVAARADGLPVLAVCFGHQALGVAFGQGVRKAPRPEAGWKSVEVLDASDPLLGGLAPSFVVFASHEDEVTPPAEGLTVLARTADCAVAAVRVPGAPMWGVQFHAELGLEEARALLVYRAGRHPELALDVEAELARSVQAVEVAPILFGRFLDVVDAVASTR